MTGQTETVHAIVRDASAGKVYLTDGVGNILAEVHEVTFDRDPFSAWGNLYSQHLNRAGALRNAEPLGKVTL